MEKSVNFCLRFLKLSKMKPYAFKTLVAFAVLLYFFILVYIKNRLESSHASSQYLLGFSGHSLFETELDTHTQNICVEKKNFVFIKGMKTATSTLLGVFYRFGFTRNLSFVLPIEKKIYLNWPFPMMKLDFRPSSLGYNILTDHSIFTENVMGEIMPHDTVYITIIREPFSHMKSLIQYFNILKIAGVPDNVPEPIYEYFSHFEQYEKNYTSPNAKQRWCIPDRFSITKNLMSHCLGMPLGFPPGTKDISNDSAAVDLYLQHLDKKFSLIMIMEYFSESLILLRRLMCWEFKDIIFVRSNVAKYDFDVSKIGQQVAREHRNRSSIDYKLYHYFNQTFWRHISKQGPRFFEEVEVFKIVEAKVNSYCQLIHQISKKPIFPTNLIHFKVAPSFWTKQFTVTPEDCWMLSQNTSKLREKMQNENNIRESVLLNDLYKLPDNRTNNMKGLC